MRADANLEKYLITVFVFIKLFVFNMLLQPHKFDEKSFPKRQEPLKANMKIIASVFYLLGK